jgi:hypothetical protein
MGVERLAMRRPHNRSARTDAQALCNRVRIQSYFLLSMPGSSYRWYEKHRPGLRQEEGLPAGRKVVGGRWRTAERVARPLIERSISDQSWWDQGVGTRSPVNRWMKAMSSSRFWT